MNSNSSLGLFSRFLASTLASLCSILLFSGCDSSPRVDGRTPDQFQASLDAIRSELTQDQIEEFDYGLSAIRSSVEKQGAGISGINASTGSERRFLERIDGMTSAQVIAEGQRIRRIRNKKVQEMFPNAKFDEES
ncbi:MAG: DUF6694 family lipoprotein [Planctomycetota bacterium]